LHPLAADLREWRMARALRATHALVFPSRGGEAWTKDGWDVLPLRLSLTSR